MNEPPELLRPARYPSGGQSPTRQRLYDDILAQTTPALAVDALSSPTDVLGRCLDDASPAERDFAMRAAVASRSVWEWVDELGDWPWPDGGGAAGFRTPILAGDGEYAGSLPLDDVVRYECRIDEIYRDMDELEVEEIKSHVMANHIMPLSRPATPVSDLGNHSGGAAPLSYNRMEDLAAVVTAIVVQMLPNLARLSHLLQVWSIRLTVLERVPALLLAIEDAEVALRSGWAATSGRARDQGAAPSLSREDVGVMRAVIEKKVTAPGRSLDYMLDRLEGLADTLPDDWLDRMEAVERGYAEWVAACERRLREAEWLMASRSARSKASPLPVEGATTSGSTGESEGQAVLVDDGAVAPPAPIRETDHQRSLGESELPARNGDASAPVATPRRDVPKSPETPPSWGDETQLHVAVDRSSPDYKDAQREVSFGRLQIPTPIKEEQTPSSRNMGKQRPSPREDEYMPEVLVSSDGVGDIELPRLPDDERLETGDPCDESTLLHGASSQFGISSEPPEVSASPQMARVQVRQAEYDASLDGSPPSSPPLPESDTRECSFAASEDARPDESSMLADQGDGAVPDSPLDGTFSQVLDRDSSPPSELASPSIRREPNEQNLRQQIGEIIQSIPARIRLESEPPDLNPPDLQLPRLRKKTSREPVRRSASGMSSRAGTPSFTLSPAKRSRHQRGQQEIEVYHLARSTGEAPIKLFIRCVGDNGERVMVRVGGGWADLSEYLKEYASHHGRRSGAADTAKVEVRDVPRVPSGRGPEPRSTPPGRPASALAASPTTTPLAVRKTRRSVGAVGSEVPRLGPGSPWQGVAPRPASRLADDVAASPEDSVPQSRPSSRLSWVEEDSSFLGLAGPSGKRVEMSEENKAWVESVREKVRMASGERRMPPAAAPQEDYGKNNKFGELGKVGGTKRLFRKGEAQALARDGIRRG